MAAARRRLRVSLQVTLLVSLLLLPGCLAGRREHAGGIENTRNEKKNPLITQHETLNKGKFHKSECRQISRDGNQLGEEASSALVISRLGN
uniref:Uncharacterized protein n=1 Tax=Oryza nivara TaxID=4536 RepID=A0A0E0G2R0_ORYNI